MKLDTIDAPTEETRLAARRAYLDLRAEIREQQDRDLDEAHARLLGLDRAAAAAYRHLSVGNQLLRLDGTVLADFDERHRPKLAILRADQTEVVVRRWRSGTMTFAPSDDPWTRRRSLVLSFDGPAFDDGPTTVEAYATAPSIPAWCRPASSLARYFVLWEAEWREKRRSARRAPRDPALLRHLGGDLWAVLAVWDLTPVERAVLEGGRL